MEFYIAVKATGEWELDVLAIPFGSRDSDGQWFDDRTEIMEESFKTPLVLYQHGVKQGGREAEDKPQVVGSVVPDSLARQVDGWHVRVLLDKTLESARRIMNAVKERAIAVSSDSIAHLARLDIGGKLIQYEKNRAGRIAVWPFAGVSLWEKGDGNMEPANQYAIAMPAMKAIYREAGQPFPDIDTTDDDKAAEVKHRTEVIEQSKRLIQQIKKKEILR